MFSSIYTIQIVLECFAMLFTRLWMNHNDYVFWLLFFGVWRGVRSHPTHPPPPPGDAHEYGQVHVVEEESSLFDSRQCKPDSKNQRQSCYSVGLLLLSDPAKELECTPSLGLNLTCMKSCVKDSHKLCMGKEFYRCHICSKSWDMNIFPFVQLLPHFRKSDFYPDLHVNQLGRYVRTSCLWTMVDITWSLERSLCCCVVLITLWVYDLWSLARAK